MSDDIEVVEVEDTEDRNWEEEARSMGWNPDYDGENKIDAKEFVGRQPLYKKIKKDQRRIRDLETAIANQQQSIDTLMTKQREKIIAELTQKREQAIESGNVKAAFDLDEKLRKETAAPQPRPENSPPPEYDEFIERNDWYQDDEDMTLFADTYGNQFRAKNPTATPKEFFEAIDAKVRQAFPHKFENPNRRAAVSVESGEGRTPSSNKREVRVPKEHKTVIEAMWRRGAWGDVSLKDATRLYVEDYTSKFGDFE